MERLFSVKASARPTASEVLEFPWFSEDTEVKEAAAALMNGKIKVAELKTRARKRTWPWLEDNDKKNEKGRRQTGLQLSKRILRTAFVQALQGRLFRHGFFQSSQWINTLSFQIVKSGFQNQVSKLIK